MEKLCKSKHLTFHDLPLELKEAIMVAGGKDNHHLFMSVCRGWYDILHKYRKRNKMPFIRQTTIKAFSFLQTLGYPSWCLQNNLPSRHLLRPLVKRNPPVLDILQWYAKTYKKTMHVDTECVYKWLGDDYHAIMQIVIKDDNLDVFKWIYEQNGEKNQYLYLTLLKHTIIREKCINILHYLENNCCIFNFEKCDFVDCIHFNFFEGIKLLQKGEYKDDIGITNAALSCNANLEIVDWLLDNGYDYNIQYYDDYLVRISI